MTISSVGVELESPRSLPLKEKFTEMLRTLTTTYENAPRQYDAFLDSFGTHYFERALFGGYIYQKAIIENSYLYASTEQAIQANLNANYMRLLKGSLAVDLNLSSINQEFTSKTRVHQIYFGGHYDQINATENANNAEWRKAVIQNPWLVGGRLIPIESLIANATLQREVKKAVMVRLTRAAIEDLRKSVLLGRISLPAKHMSLLHRIEKFFEYEEYRDNSKDGADTVELFNGNIGNLFAKVEEIRGKSGSIHFWLTMYCKN